MYVTKKRPETAETKRKMNRITRTRVLRCMYAYPPEEAHVKIKINFKKKEVTGD